MTIEGLQLIAFVVMILAMVVVRSPLWKMPIIPVVTMVIAYPAIIVGIVTTVIK